jgi:hypothetical protein
MNGGREDARVVLLIAERHFAVGERTLLIGPPQGPVVALETAESVVGAEIVYHLSVLLL